MGRGNLKSGERTSMEKNNWREDRTLMERDNLNNERKPYHRERT